MARAMVTLTWCDKCLAEKDEEVPAAAMPPFEGMQVDLCPECAVPLQVARNVYAEYGSKGPRSTVKPATIKKAVAAAAAPEKVRSNKKLGPHICPACKVELGSRGSLSAHVRQMHDTQLPLLEGKPVTETCSDCGAGFATLQALKMHQRKHARQRSAAGKQPARKSA